MFVELRGTKAGSRMSGIDRKFEIFTEECGVNTSINPELDDYQGMQHHEANIRHFVDVVNGKYAEAKAKLAGSKGFNEALVCILTNDLAGAEAIVGNAKCQCKSYLKAIVAARQGKVDAAKAALEVAKKDEKLAKRAENDIEFAKVK